VYVRKAKVTKRPRFDVSKLLELHTETVGNPKQAVPESAENTLTAEIRG